MKENDIEKRFRRDTAEHEMTILRDEGVNRHVRFRKPGTICYGFDLITWAGHLCYTGDMGTYVFSRIEDMFEFFRTKNPRREEGQIYINTGYWAEKALAVDKTGKLKEFSREKFEECIAYYLEGREATPEVCAAVKEEILSHGYSNEYEAREAVDNFSCGKFRFDDFWDHDISDYSHHFYWCCYALSWGIEKYDEAKALVTV